MELTTNAGATPAADPHATRRDPFEARFDVPVAGGALHVARAGAPTDAAEAAVLAVHGVTASHVAWRAVARQLVARTRACVIAPDLRGRGRSATLPSPYGFAAHVRDLTAVLDHTGVERAVLVGHSMGAYVVARLAAEQPDRVAGLVLVDGGLPLPAPMPAPEDEPEQGDPTAWRTEGSCTSADEYIANWRAHPAFARVWNEDLHAFASYDMARDGQVLRCVVSQHAVLADGAQLMLDGVTRTAIRRVDRPVRLLRASRGPLDDDCAVIPPAYLEGFAAGHPHVHVEHVDDTNHFTLLLGDGPGPSRVAAAVEAAVRDAAP